MLSRNSAKSSSKTFRTALCRSHSSSSAPPLFAPSGSTSANTEIPYGDPSCASSSYLPQHPSSAPQTPEQLRASTEKPNLTPEQKDVIEKIIRVDQAGELGANLIYEGQHFVLKRKRDKKVASLVQDMWDGEKKHIAAFDKLIHQHEVRPTALYPLWKVAGFALGAGTAILGKRAAMACTEAVETAIGEHYDAQIRSLSSPLFPPETSHPSIPLLKEIITEFRDDELGHLDTAVQNESQLAPAHALLSALIGGGCRVAIAVSEKI
ncbi:COQ7 protein [Meredithblackwellia eburnea MCA 4105]